MAKKNTSTLPRPSTNGTEKADPQAVAEAQAEMDAQLLAALQERDSESSEESTTTTLADSYRSVAEMIARTKREYRLGEPTLIKLWELTLMWELNMQQQARAREAQNPYPMPTPRERGDSQAEEGPEPHETIEAAPEQE